MCTQTGYCREHGISHEVWGDGPMTCERAQQIRARLTAHAPTAAESAEFWADEPAEYALERVVWHPGATNGSKMSTDTPAASSAGRSPAQRFSPCDWPDCPICATRNALQTAHNESREGC